MIRMKLGLLGLCAMLFGLMAFGASGAQAEGKWLILVTPGGVVKTGEELPATLQLEKDSEHYILKSEILKIPVTFLCTEIKAVNAKIFGAGAIGEGPGKEEKSKILFSGCKTFLKGAEATECTPTDPADGKGFIVTKNGHALAILHELKATGVKHDVIKVLPDEGETFATIALPAACPIGTSVPVIGEVSLEDCKELALVHAVKHLVQPFKELTKLWTISKTTEHVATLEGSAWAFLTGEHLGKEWSISGL